MIELGQLICSAGFSNEYKVVNRGKAIQDWIKQHPVWTYWYYKDLLFECKDIFKQPAALKRAVGIKTDLLLHGCQVGYQTSLALPDISTAVFRYKQGYKSKYATNTELSIKIACAEYINYIERYKFNKENKHGNE